MENSELSSEDEEARKKGFALVAFIEYLYLIDVEFRKWYHEGISEIEAGHFVVFDDAGWSEDK